MERTLFSPEHEAFRGQVRRFLETEAIPNLPAWETSGSVPRSMWTKAGELGFLCTWLEECWGGPGGDFLHALIVGEEIARSRCLGLTFDLHSDIVVPYLYNFGTDDIKQRWLPKCASGHAITAIAMTEPNAGSDLAALQTRAVRDGSDYVINGQKIFITNGTICDLAVVACRTDPLAKPAHRGISLLLVEADRPGFIKARKLSKMGMRSSDTAEIFFEDCRVPATNLLGQEGQGFKHMMLKLQQERLVSSNKSQAAAEAVLELTKTYCQDRQLFGQSLSKFQNTQFTLAEVATEVTFGRVFLDRLIADHMAGKHLPVETSMAKWWISEMAKRTTDRCLQLHGGYGYMTEYEICQRYMDIRANTIFAGTTEVMKAIIAKNLGLC